MRIQKLWLWFSLVLSKAKDKLEQKCGLSKSMDISYNNREIEIEKKKREDRMAKRIQKTFAVLILVVTFIFLSPTLLIGKSGRVRIQLRPTAIALQRPAVPPPPAPPQPQGPPIPQGIRPLMDNEQRTRELLQSLEVAFIGKNSWEDHQHKYALLDRQAHIDRCLLRALVVAGCSRQSVLAKRGEIRSSSLYRKNGDPLSLRTLDQYLQQIRSVGISASRPFLNVCREISNCGIVLERRRR